MTDKRERSVQPACIQLAEDRGYMVRKVVAVSHEGFPDLFLCSARAGVLLVEVKRPKTWGEDTPHTRRQNREGRKLRRSGCPVYKVRDAEAMKLLLAKVSSSVYRNLPMPGAETFPDAECGVIAC